MRVCSNRRAPFKNEIGALLQHTRGSVRVLSHPLHPNHKLLGFRIKIKKHLHFIRFQNKVCNLHKLQQTLFPTPLAPRPNKARIISYSLILFFEKHMPEALSD